MTCQNGANRHIDASCTQHEPVNSTRDRDRDALHYRSLRTRRAAGDDMRRPF
jgi:hypothetical protein